LYLTGVSGIRPNGSLHCVAECADPECNPVSYTWLHNGEVLSENTSSRRIYGNGTISILKVTSSVSGWYQCRAMAGGGNWGIFTAPVEVKKVGEILELSFDLLDYSSVNTLLICLSVYWLCLSVFVYSFGG
jgi:hypothetical protein